MEKSEATPLTSLEPTTSAGGGSKSSEKAAPVARVAWPHQVKGIELASARTHYAFFWEMGVGKTYAAIQVLRSKYNARGSIISTLILGPPIILHNWRREFLAHSKIEPKKIVILEGTGKERLKILQEALAKYGEGIVVIANYESLLMEPVLEALQRWAPQCLVADEVHRCRDVKAKRTKRTILLADTADHLRLILTGTPVLNTPLDLFAQYRILDGGAAFGKSFMGFRARFFYDKNASMAGLKKYFPDWRPKPTAAAELNRIIQDSSMHVKKSECLTLPPLVKKVIPVQLSATQKKHYKELKTELITFMDDKACTAPIALTKALRLQQIVSGYITLEGTEHVSFKENPRAAVLSDLLSELAPHHKVIVWAVFQINYATIRAVLEGLSLKYVEVHGQVSAAEKQRNVDSFNDDPECRVLLGHPGSGGLGINLVAASYSIYYSRGFSLENDLQSEARNYRGGSEIHEKVTRIDLVAEGTIDEEVMAALAAKEEIGNQILRRLKEKE